MLWILHVSYAWLPLGQANHQEALVQAQVRELAALLSHGGGIGRPSGGCDLYRVERVKTVLHSKWLDVLFYQSAAERVNNEAAVKAAVGSADEVAGKRAFWSTAIQRCRRRGATLEEQARVVA